MNPASRQPSAARQALAALLFALVFAAGAPLAAQEEPLPGEGDRPFNGSFSEWSLRGSINSTTPELSESLGGEVAFRSSFPLYLGDVRLAYRLSPLGDVEPGPVHALHLALNLHPLYLTLLSEGLLSHFLASLHLELGFGPQLATGPEDGPAFGFAGSVGAGFDLPITRANRGQGIWLTATYRRTWTTLRTGVDQPRAHEHAALLGLAWRTNGLIF
ncbi:hypothetical protein FRC98_07740 [Lujinxingia vulgaris]|uniref:Outer membrane protein beta-barrel domain-containing protein n=1 Tax=Lujinxingia vulgaris TaxID=2600176 RepID=A0A5C6X6Y1_9DELT|nr:hypothetical protein [Lujinxingia vulgaris]TXD37573.1 hypothetical protein FRC98_07740 [Lujinxingia vulgaris]